MAIKKTIEIEVNTDESVKEVNQLTTSINKTDKQTEATKKTTDSLTDSLDKMTGGAVTGFKSMVSGARNGIVAMKSLKVAIAATGIGLLVIAVGSLVTYFTQTQRGADLVSKAFSGIGATVSVLIDRVSSFGEGLAMIFSGEYKKGADLLKNSVKGIGEEIKKEATAAWDLDDALKSLEDREIALITVNARREQSIKDLRLEAQKSMDNNEKRNALLTKAMQIQDQMYNEEVSIAKERARISTEQLALGESTRDEIRANAELQANVIRLESERADRQRELQSELNGTISRERELTEAIRQRQAVEGIGSNLETAGTNELDTFKELQKSKFETLEQYQQRKLTLEQNTANAQIKIDTLLKDQQIDMAGSVAGSIATALGTQSKVGKAAAIFQALVNTYQGITAGVKLGYPAAIPAVAAAAATGFAAVKNIAATKLPNIPGMGGGGGMGGNSTPKAPPTPSFNIVGNNTGNNQLGDAINGLIGMSNRPIQTYVVGSQITDQQALDRNIRQTASIG